ncbi:hypothetical protein D3W54_11070 [Komagataeibacter medellinensis]|uniref:Uncharacterized protein n=2 Tax=Komagataeibacter medellinensis TaxID=1177712 RepID=G2I5X0_KOMMN|nr:hypothetical protein [Komagataeibacter medellinensis]KAB8124620.1 hypothetical protein D3W54_11070 [Komagataeibacter medellinensis]BAK83517.1 hypothetical protein GLX_11050 [Komagataeibacter medellinensis NBRC 3288]
MSFGDRVNQFDSWLLDRIFQPFADALPERLTAMEVGMSFQVGSIVLSAASISALLVLEGMTLNNVITNLLGWFFEVIFYIGIHRLRRMVRPGYQNPLRVMLAGMRPISIPFAAYAVYQAVTAERAYELALWFNSLSQLVFVAGIYLISCNIPPPGHRARQTSFGRGPLPNEIG